MWQVMRKRAAFTLIELLVVVIIVAVLAAVGIPLLSAAVERSKMSEAEAGLGTLRTAMRAEFSERGPVVGWSTIPISDFSDPALQDAVGIADNDLNGRFFAEQNYEIVSRDVIVYCAGVTGATGTAPRGNEVDTRSRSMNEDGDLFDDASCGTGGGQLLN